MSKTRVYWDRGTEGLSPRQDQNNQTIVAFQVDTKDPHFHKRNHRKYRFIHWSATTSSYWSETHYCRCAFLVTGLLVFICLPTETIITHKTYQTITQHSNIPAPVVLKVKMLIVKQDWDLHKVDSRSRSISRTQGNATERSKENHPETLQLQPLHLLWTGSA